MIVKNNSFRKKNKKTGTALIAHSVHCVKAVHLLTLSHAEVGKNDGPSLFSFWFLVFTPNNTVTTSATYYAKH